MKSLFILVAFVTATVVSAGPSDLLRSVRWQVEAVYSRTDREIPKDISEKDIEALQPQIVGITTSVICLLQDAVIKVGSERLSACADFVESKLSLLVQYPIDFRGSPRTILAALIEGLLPQSSIATIHGHAHTSRQLRSWLTWDVSQK
jgi:hypothetical protein